MRKNSVRKWLHAILDFLPLLVIPIFAIYTRNENYNSNIEIEVQEKVSIDFNQLLNYESYSASSTIAGMTYTNNQNGTYSVSGTSTQNANKNILWYTNFKLNHIYILKGTPSNGSWSTYYMFLAGYGYDLGNGTRFKASTTNGANLQIGIVSGTYSSLIFKPQLYDLTQMYGEGNEPSIQEFNTIFTNDLYPYTISQKELVDKPNPTTYNDTDIGSQFVYTLYNATDKYFNCTNLFNLEQVWNWVQLNLFSGTAPLMVYVVWQVIVYEFFMDLIFLLYSVFMFIIDFATNTLERFYRRSC